MENLNNYIISRKEIIDILNSYSNISDKIYNENLYKIAFCNNCFYEQLKEEKRNDLLEKIFIKNNETYETVGDSLISSIIVTYLEDRFEEENEEFISTLKILLTKTEGLAYLAKTINFPKYVLLSSKSEKEIINTYVDIDPTIGRNNSVFLENCFESFIGALFIDFKIAKSRGFAYDICYSFIESLLDNVIDFSRLILFEDNYKIILQKILHKYGCKIPIYEDIKTELDNQSKRIYTRGIYLSKMFLNNKQITYVLQKFKQTKLNESKLLIGTGMSYKKRLADQICAKECIELLDPKILECDIEIC